MFCFELCFAIETLIFIYKWLSWCICLLGKCPIQNEHQRLRNWAYLKFWVICVVLHYWFLATYLFSGEEFSRPSFMIVNQTTFVIRSSEIWACALPHCTSIFTGMQKKVHIILYSTLHYFLSKVESKATLFLQAKVVLVSYRACTNRFLMVISMQNILR